MSCPRLLEEGQHGYVLRPLARQQRRVRRYEGAREAPHQQCAQQRQALPLRRLHQGLSDQAAPRHPPTHPHRGEALRVHLAWLPPGLRAAEQPHPYSSTSTRETSPTSARPTPPSARRHTRPSARCWTTSPPGTTVSRGGSARMPSVGSGSTTALPGRCMCGRRIRGRRGRVRSSGVMCRVTAPQPEPGMCSASTSTAHRSTTPTWPGRGSTRPTGGSDSGWPACRERSPRRW